MDPETTRLLLLLVRRCKNLDALSKKAKIVLEELVRRAPQLSVELAIAHQKLAPDLARQINLEYSAVERAMIDGTDFRPALRVLLSHGQSTPGSPPEPR